MVTTGCNNVITNLVPFKMLKSEPISPLPHYCKRSKCNWVVMRRKWLYKEKLSWLAALHIFRMHFKSLWTCLLLICFIRVTINRYEVYCYLDAHIAGPGVQLHTHTASAISSERVKQKTVEDELYFLEMVDLHLSDELKWCW